MPSMSTGGAAVKEAIIKRVVAARRRGNHEDAKPTNGTVGCWLTSPTDKILPMRSAVE